MKNTGNANVMKFCDHIIVGLFVALLVMRACIPVQAAENPGGLTVLVQEAMARNLDILSQEEKSKALRAEAPFAGSLKDPVLGLALLNLPVDSFEFDQQPMTQKQISLSQQVPWFGKLSLAEQGAELMATEQEAMVKALRLNVARQVKESWYELSLVERSLDINSRLREIITQILRVAETRYATGEGLQQDILMAQVQLSELIDREVSLNASRRKLQDAIGSLLNRDDLYLESSEKLEMPDLSDLKREDLTALALQKNPLVEAKRTAAMKAEIDVKLAEKEYMPDMNFTVAYGQRDELEQAAEHDDVDFFSAGVTFTVPLWQNTRQSSKLEGARLRLSSAQRSLHSLQKTLPHRVDSLVAEIDGARESKELFGDAISIQAEQLADSSLAAYSVGEVEFGTMLSTRTRLLQVELKIEQYIVQVYKKLAELEETVGQPFSLTKEKL